MPKQIYDVIVIGTGAGGGMAMKTLCEAGLKVCALNAGRRLDPEKDFRNHRKPWDMKFRGFGNPDKWAESYGFMDSEWLEGVWEHEIPFTTAPGTKWMWPRCFAVGGKTNFWGRSSARFGDIDFRAASLDGHDVDWPITYAEIAPYYSRTERMVGVSSTVQNRPSNPDGEYLPPFNFRCIDRILQAGAEKIGVPYLPDRISQLTKDHEGHPACHYCGGCTTGCDTGSFFSTPWRLMTSDQNAPADQRSDSNLPRPVYAESEYGRLSFGWSTLRALRTEKYLYIAAPERELYDQTADPLAAHNLATHSKAVADTEAALLAEFYRKTKGAAAEKTALNMEQNESLHALGYMSSSTGVSSDPDNQGGPDPKQEIAAANLFL